MRNPISNFALGAVLAGLLVAPPSAQQPAQPGAVTAAPGGTQAKGDKSDVQNLPSGYVIGADDVLNIVFWREPDMSGEVVVRPDGRIALPLINEVVALGKTPAELREVLTTLAAKFIADPNVSVGVSQINSRKVSITGMVQRGGPYPLGGPMTVLQLIAAAGGLQEYANAKNIVIIRTQNGKSTSLPFNYNDVSKGKSLHQNIELMPGDTVIVP